MNTTTDLSLPGLPGFLGIRIRHLSTDGAFPDIEGTLPVHEDLLAPTGQLHAATVVALADTAAGYGCLASLPDHATGFTTIELTCNFLSTAAVDDTLTVLATAAHRGRTTQIWDATVSADIGSSSPRTVGLFRCTQLLLTPRDTGRHQ